MKKFHLLPLPSRMKTATMKTFLASHCGRRRFTARRGRVPGCGCPRWCSKAPQPPPKHQPTCPTCPPPHPGPAPSPVCPASPAHRGTQQPPSPTNRETLEGRSASPIPVSPPHSSGYQRHLLTTYQAVLNPLKSISGVRSGSLVCCGRWKICSSLVTFTEVRFSIENCRQV